MTDKTDDGWIEWKGGACPVEPDTLIQFVFRDKYSGLTNLPQEFRWAHSGLASDIILYRVLRYGQPRDIHPIYLCPAAFDAARRAAPPYLAGDLTDEVLTRIVQVMQEAG